MKQKEGSQQAKINDHYIGLTYDDMLGFIAFKDKKQHGMKYYITSMIECPVLMKIVAEDSDMFHSYDKDGNDL